MTRRTAPLLTSAALLSAVEALASPPCDGPAVEVDAHVTPQWQREIVDVIQRMRRLPDIDRCARITVTPVGPDLRVEVTLSDGRVTLRAVHDPGELRAWIDPLLIVPPRLDPPVAAPLPAAPVAPPATPVRVTPRRPRFRLSIDTHARWHPSRGTLTTSAGLTAGLVTGGWVFGASAAIGYPSELSLGLEAGRRIAFDDASIDLLGTARVAQTVVRAGSNGAATGIDPTVSVGVGARASWHVHPHVAPYAALAVEYAALAPPAAPLAERLSATASVGVAWE